MLLQPCHQAHPSTAENIRCFAYPARPSVLSEIGSLTEGLCMAFHLSVRCSGLRPTNSAQRPAGNAKLLPFP